MTVDSFIRATLDRAQAAGIAAAEIYLASRDSFRAMCLQGAINNYTVNSTRGLSLRGLYNGKMGYAATEALDEEAVEQLVQGVIESAELTEDTDIQEIRRQGISRKQPVRRRPGRSGRTAEAAAGAGYG